ATAIPAPVRGGQIAMIGEELLLTHRDGVWIRSASESGWIPVAEDPDDLLRTGDSGWPLVLTGSERGLLANGEGEWRHLELPFPPRDLLSAAVFGGRLYLGTAGSGLLSRPLEELPVASFPDPITTASGAVPASQ
ncbi:MAG: hypothetical protein R3234_08200, partial [Thermoanaerobaculia bacterium]|nr:hypothetical protein [Thermoanaerobaculia bacterium]